MPYARDLFDHPQAELAEVVVVERHWMLTCADCGLDGWKLRGASVGEDGKLRCQNCDPQDWRNRRRWTPPTPEPPPARRCEHCDGPIRADRRADARFCSGRCRVAAHRAAWGFKSPLRHRTDVR